MPASMAGIAVSEIVKLVGGKYAGPEKTISGVAGLAEAGPEHLSFLSNRKYESQVASSNAGAILISGDASDDPRFIKVANPYVALADVLTRFFDNRPPAGVSPLASVPKSAKIGQNVSIAPFVTVGENVVIGDDTIISAGVSIANGCVIGRRCIVHGGVVIGSDGFGFAFDGKRHKKIPQIGIVRIEDDVEIGANTTIDRAALGETLIGEGTKIDNQVQIGHNVRIGKHCIIVAQVGIAGSTELGDYVIVAGQAGISGHLKIGHRAQITGATKVFHDVEDGAKVIGNPAIPFREHARREVLLRRLIKKRD
jgi:UDP-3-O-[3-hydroxymyristoyl] glucosamine N-acyltransferase